MDIFLNFLFYVSKALWHIFYIALNQVARFDANPKEHNETHKYNKESKEKSLKFLFEENQLVNLHKKELHTYI